MNAKINFKDAAGKTVRSVVPYCEDEVLVSFTDGTFSVIRAACLGYEDELDTDADFTLAHWSSKKVMEALFGNDAEALMANLKARRENEMAVREEEARQRRKEEYERLKQEFEGK